RTGERLVADPSVDLGQDLPSRARGPVIDPGGVVSLLAQKHPDLIPVHRRAGYQGHGRGSGVRWQAILRGLRKHRVVVCIGRWSTPESHPPSQERWSHSGGPLRWRTRSSGTPPGLPCDPCTTPLRYPGPFLPQVPEEHVEEIHRRALFDHAQVVRLGDLVPEPVEDVSIPSHCTTPTFVLFL